jgi:hypothetical protein
MMSYADLLASADARAWQNQANAQGQQGISNNQWQQQFDWTKQLGTAGQTGMWNGQYNMPSNQFFANTFGQWLPQGPQAGQQTLAGQQTAADIAQNWSNMFGQYYAPGTAPTQGQQTQAALQAGLGNAATVAGLTGYYNTPGGTGPGTQTLAGQQQQWQQGFSQQQFAAQQQQLQQQNAQAYLGLLSNLRGPADWAKYQQVLGSTPGGMRDLAAAAMGQYVPGGGATTGVAPQAANLNSMLAQIQGSPNTYAYPQQQNWAQQQAQFQQNPPQWQSAQYGQPAASGTEQLAVMPNGYNGANMRQQYAGMQNQAAPQQQYADQAWGSGIGVGQQAPTGAQAQQATGNGTNMYGGQQQQYNLPAPNQIASQSWQNMAPSQQQMLLGQYESNGWDKGDVQALYNQSLPKYGSNNATAGTWRLQ